MPFDQLGAALHGLLDNVVSLISAAWPAVAPLVGVVIGAVITARQQTRVEHFQQREAKTRKAPRGVSTGVGDRLGLQRRNESGFEATAG